MSKSIRDGIGYRLKEEHVLHQNQTLQKQLLIHLCKDNYFVNANKIMEAVSSKLWNNDFMCSKRENLSHYLGITLKQ